MSSIVRGLISGACVIGVVACSAEDDGDSRQRYTSGVADQNTQVSMLDTTQQREICESLDVFVDVNVGFDAVAYVACLPAAIVLGGTEQGCEAELDRCMSAFPQPVSVQGTGQAVDVCFDDLADCNATVASLEGCINLNLDFLYDVLDRWTCGDAASSDMRQQAAAFMNDASVCADVDAACNRAAAIVGPD